jgi:hypothetical protein
MGVCALPARLGAVHFPGGTELAVANENQVRIEVAICADIDNGETLCS